MTDFRSKITPVSLERAESGGGGNLRRQRNSDLANRMTRDGWEVMGRKLTINGADASLWEIERERERERGVSQGANSRANIYRGVRKPDGATRHIRTVD